MDLTDKKLRIRVKTWKKRVLFMVSEKGAYYHWSEERVPFYSRRSVIELAFTYAPDQWLGYGIWGLLEDELVRLLLIWVICRSRSLIN